MNFWASATKATLQSKWGMYVLGLTPGHEWDQTGADVEILQTSSEHTEAMGKHACMVSECNPHQDW